MGARTIFTTPIRIVISGRSLSGKTVLLINLLMQPELLCGKFDRIVIFSPTAYSQDEQWYALDSPDENEDIVLYEKYDEDVLIEEIGKKVDKDDSWLIVFDDCLGQVRKGMGYTSYLDQLMARSRHNNISIIINTQSIMALSQSMKQDTDMFIIFEQYKVREIERLHEECYFMEKAEFIKLLEFCTKESYSFLIIKKGKPIKFFRKFEEIDVGTIIKET